MILLDSSIVKPVNPPQYIDANNYPLQYTSSATASSFQPLYQSNQSNYSLSDQNNLPMVSTIIGQTSMPVDNLNVINPTLDLNRPTEYQFDVVTSGTSCLPTSELVCSNSMEGLGENYQDIFTPLNSAADLGGSKVCCDNESILECVTLGCSTSIESRP